MRLSFIIGFTFLSFSCLAQDSAQTLKNVVVLSQRLEIPVQRQNRNIVILTKAEIKQLGLSSINSLLSYIAGVDIRRRGPQGAQADVGIEGGTFDQTLILLNGIQMSDPQTGHNSLNIPVPIDAIERIEILKGPAARVFGVNALTGAINIVTRSVDKRYISAHVYSGSSFANDTATDKMYYSAGAQVVYGIAKKSNNNSLLAASYDAGNGFRYNTAFNNGKLLYSGKYRLSNNVRINTTAGYIHNKFGANAFYAAPKDVEATEEVQVVAGGISAEIKASDNWKIKPSIGIRYGKDDYIFTRKNPSFYRNIHETSLIDFGINNSIKNSLGTLGIGLFLRQDAINSSNLGKNTRSNTGFFAEQYFSLSAKMNLTAGFFVNNNSVFGLKVYPGIDVGYQVNDSLRIYFNMGTGQRIPTYTDLYYKGPSNIGNSALQPEWAINYEAGISKTGTKIGFSASAFYRYGKGFIDWVRENATKPWQPQNFTNVYTKGFTIQYKHKLVDKAAIGFSTKAAYTFLDPKVASTENNASQSKYIVNALKHQFVVQALASLKNKFGISVTNRYLYRMNTDDITGYKRKAYNLLDATLNCKLSKAEVYFTAENLGNIQYIESGVTPLPGRWCTVGIRFQKF